jgi:hypothetical protein
MENPMSKTLFAAAAASLLLVGAAAAQTAPAPAPAHDEHHSARPTIESPIEALMADPATKSVMEKHLPGMDKHPAYGQFKGMSLRQVAPYSQGAITDEKIAAIEADLKALPAA